MKTLSRADSAYNQLTTKSDFAESECSTESALILRPLQGRSEEQALNDLNQEVVDTFGVEHSFMGDVARAGLLSRTFLNVTRVRDNHVRVVRDEHTMRERLVPTGAYRAQAFNPYQQRSWVDSGRPIYEDISLNEGRMRSVHLEPGQACKVRLPNGRLATQHASFVAFCLEMPLQVGTRWYPDQRLAQGCLLGVHQVPLSVGSLDAGRYYRLGADTRAIVLEPDSKPTQYEPNSGFEVSPAAQVMTWPVLGQHLSLQGVRTQIADGAQSFACVANAKVTDPAACLRQTGGDLEKFVRGEIQRALDAHLSKSHGHQLFEGSALTEKHDVNQQTRQKLGRVETVVAAACCRAGITLDGLAIKPVWEKTLGQAVETIRDREITAMVGRATHDAAVEAHAYKQEDAQRAVVIDHIEAQKVSRTERLRLLEKLIEGRNLDRII